MGLDAVEIILRSEELFVITIGDDEAAAVRTVGDFYNHDLHEARCDAIGISSYLRGASDDLAEGKEAVFFLSIVRLSRR